MQSCVGCGQTLPDGDKFCAKCGKQQACSSPSATLHAYAAPKLPKFVRPDDAQFNYNDFGFCKKCDAVNLISSARCRSCQATEGIAPLPENYFGSKEFWAMAIIGTVSLFFLPISLLCATRMVYMFWRYSSEQKQARARIRQEAAVLFEDLKQEQFSKASEEMQNAIAAFNIGMWEKSHQLFVNSMLLGLTTPEQPLGAAVTAFNLARYTEVLQYCEKCGTDRTIFTKELRARALLRLGTAAPHDLEWLSEIAPTFPTKLKRELAVFVADQWLKAPYLQEKIEKFFMQLRAEWPSNPRYSEVLARFKLLERKVEDAFAICASIPSDNHTEGSLQSYSEALRTLNDDSEQAFAIAQRYWSACPGNIENTLYCARLSIKRKDANFAEQVIRRGLASSPTDHRLRYHLALVLKLSGRLPECIAELQDLLRSPESEAYRSHEDFRLLMAKCLIESGVYDAAVRQLQGLNRKREVLDLLYEIGSKYSEAGRTEKANECWQEIYAVDVRYKDVLSKISGSSNANMKAAAGK